MSIRVLLVDDHTIIRDGLSAFLRAEEDIIIVAEAGTGREAIAMAREHAPDVVVMDMALPDMGGVMAMRQIVAENPAINALVLSMFLDRTCLFECLEARARGYLVKDCAADELVAAIRTVHQGRPYFCSGAQEIMMNRIAPEESGSTLTKRETEVLKLTAEGLNTKEIAFRLGVSVKMIEVHRMNIKTKLGLNNIAQMATYAARTGLISLS